jgi:hemerythrin superfamily protein
MKTTARLLNGLSRHPYQYLACFPRLRAPRGTAAVDLLTFIATHTNVRYILSMGGTRAFPPGFKPDDGGTLDATAVLEREHAHLRHLLDELGQAATDRAHDQKKALFRTFKTALHVHARREEEVFYPAVMKLRSDVARRTVKEALEEHQAVDSMIAEIDQMEPEDGQYDAKLESLRTSIDHHARTEEQAMFAEARNHLTDDRLLALGRQMVALRETPPALDS